MKDTSTETTLAWRERLFSALRELRADDSATVARIRDRAKESANRSANG